MGCVILNLPNILNRSKLNSRKDLSAKTLVGHLHTLKNEQIITHVSLKMEISSIDNAENVLLLCDTAFT